MRNFSDSRVFAPPIVLFVVIGAIGWVRSQKVPVDASYAGSATCASCHAKEYEAWKTSLHQKMMRPADNPGVVIADLGPHAEDLPFDGAEAVWAIGGKWEQQFIGRDASGETLLPGAWLRAEKRWDLTTWDGWQVPAPLERCHGCHTLGLDVETGSFLEANVGCESCHGVGQWHVNTKGMGRIYRGGDAQTCGQCHSRGRSTKGKFFFPVGYRPGEALESYFELEEPSPLQNSNSWWAHGHARRRHQEYTAWKTGGHSESLKHIQEGYDGRYGKAGKECLPCHSGDYTSSAAAGELRFEDAQNGITCSTCHNVHGALDSIRRDCGDCHVDGPYYHESDRNDKHIPCPDRAQVGCVNCHMPRTAKIGGQYALHSHSPGIIEPKDGLRWSSPSSCVNGACHTTTDQNGLQMQFDAHYGTR